MLDVCEFGGQFLELLWLTVCYRGSKGPTGGQDSRLYSIASELLVLTQLNEPELLLRCDRWLYVKDPTHVPARIMADKEKDVPVVEDEDETGLNYQPPAQKSLQEIQELDKDDESLNKYKQTLLGSGPVVAGDLVALKKKNFILKEGVDYRVKIHFKVNRDIVSGLKYVHLTYRKGVRVDKSVYMVGSYGPRLEEHEFMTPVEEAPKGLIVRGSYHIKSCFTDDDKTDHLSWEWNLQIKKDWDSTD
ncbi:hypothetical protein DNTS_004508 [Danionella cerebrum]|uniref:Rho GDP-dissociation inhibitor 2 n=1 Tax=Danionella cerebrum TaxID=2873325 RepID=A0A553QL70_9TELE|nr:hypothetical protein DNTS_004508 [Danionella translucida]